MVLLKDLKVSVSTVIKIVIVAFALGGSGWGLTHQVNKAVAQSEKALKKARKAYEERKDMKQEMYRQSEVLDLIAEKLKVKDIPPRILEPPIEDID